jgi:hypothetical protein
MPTPHIPSALLGLPTATLQLWLTEAQTALHYLTTGRQTAVASYAEGTGSRSVTYTKATIGDLRVYIRQLQEALGVASPRRAIGVYYRRPYPL